MNRTQTLKPLGKEAEAFGLVLTLVRPSQDGRCHRRSPKGVLMLQGVLRLLSCPHAEIQTGLCSAGKETRLVAGHVTHSQACSVQII